MFCKYCGKNLTVGAQFCDRCGAKTESVPNAIETPTAYSSANTRAEQPAVSRPPAYTPHMPSTQPPVYHAENMAPAPPQKSILGLVAIITAAVVVVVCTASYFLFFAGPPAESSMQSGIYHEDSPAIDTPAVSDSTPDEEQPEPNGQNEQNGSSDSDTENNQLAGEPTESAGEPEAPQQTPQPDAADYSTSDRPDLGDFLWYIDGVYYDGLPSGRTPVSGFSELVGGWKAYIWYDPDNLAGVNGWDFLNVTIDGSASDTSVTLDWYMTGPMESGNSIDVTAIADTVMAGAYTQSVLSAGEPGYMIYLTDFYYLNGKQYCVGYMSVQSGEETFVALVRP